MLRRTSEILGWSLHATDGSIGSVADLLFDDTEWTVRWVVVDSGTWLPGRKVLLPPASFGEPDPVRRELPVDATREQVKESPGIDMDAPVSRRMEADLSAHYGWSPYWAAAYPPMAAAVPPYPTAGAAQAVAADATRAAPREEVEREGDPHLRSASEVTGYHIHATDGEIGHVEDFLVDGETWAIRYMMVDTKNWWPGKMVLVAPRWLRDVNWSDRSVSVDLSRSQVKESPEYEALTDLDRPFEERLYRHYGFPPYWL